jgi:hypothetical protein
MAIKSAYELAMERMGGQPGKKLTAQQKAKLAELDKVYTAKIAECELELNPKIVGARSAGKPEDAEKLEETLRAQIAKLRAKLEAEKEKVRQAK